MKSMYLPLTLFALVATANGAFGESLRDQILKMNRLVSDALVKKDIARFVSLERGGVTADFKHVEAGRALNFDQMAARMKAGLGMLSKMTEAKATLVSLKISGNRATAVTRHAMGGILPPGADHKIHSMRFVGDTTDVYRREGGKWKLASMTWTSERQFMDGHAIDPSKMGGR